MLKKSVIMLIFVMLSSNVLAATIHGTVFDLYLDELEGAVVRINTTPEQVKVAKDTTYSFIAPKGDYVITATYSNDESFAIEQNITINDDGDYTFDLILLPDLEEDVLGDIDLDELEEQKTNPWLIVFIIIINMLVVVYLIKWFTAKKKIDTEEKAAESGDLDALVEFIKKEGGRVTQKDIRKKLPLSEAKISLMITELEHKGILEKIKKGRGNIIILKK